MAIAPSVITRTQFNAVPGRVPEADVTCPTGQEVTDRQLCFQTDQMTEDRSYGRTSGEQKPQVATRSTTAKTLTIASSQLPKIFICGPLEQIV
ncbi:hypothetical protein [Streptomyces sp. NPDC002553]|uniref:hypothetical protein n=1 Tax=unclassified Streptomyces TaxID=2593676 RepID=UPI0033286F55